MGSGMTDGPPDIVVDFSPAWASVTWGADIDSWAPAAAERLWSSSGQPFSELDIRLLAAKLDVMARSAFVVPCFGAFVFCPELGRGPRAVLRLTGVRFPSGSEERDMIEEVTLSTDQQLLAPAVEQMCGPGLRRIRIRQRTWMEDKRVVADHIAYLFPFEGSAWLLSTLLPDPREADRWLADFDELSTGVHMRESA